MFCKQHLIIVTAAMLVSAAGTLAAPVQDRQQDRNHDRSDRAQERADKRANARVELWSELRNIDLHNNADTKIGDLEDAVIDRGTGRIHFLIVETTSAANREGKTVLLPYRSLYPTRDDDKMRLDATTADLSTAPEFRKGSWDWVRNPLNAKPDNNRDNATNRAVAEALAAQAALDQSDTYYNRWPSNSSTVRVEGEIVGVDRRVVENGGEYTYLFVRPNNGAAPQTVVLGPSWHVMGNSVVPVRGSHFAGDTIRIGENDNSELVVISSTIDGQEQRYRDPKGVAVWNSKDGASLSNRYILASELKGKTVQLRNDKAGEIENLVFELGSGRLAFVTVDPNENFLGIGDTKRLVPWTIVYARPDGTVAIDASKEMLVASTAVPKDIHRLSDPDTMRTAYNAFNVTPQSFYYREMARDAGVWSRDGAIGMAIRNGQAKRIDGPVLAIQRAPEPFTNSDTTYITISENGMSKLVALAPSLASDCRSIKTGDQLSVEVWEVKSPDGRLTWIARNITRDGRMVANWGNAPE